MLLVIRVLYKVGVLYGAVRVIGDGETGGAGEQGAEGLCGGRGGVSAAAACGGGGGGGGGGAGGGGLEVELRSRAVQHNGGSVVGAGGVLGRGKGAEPAAHPLARLSDLGHPFAPAALADPPVLELVVVWAAFAGSVFSSAASTVGVATGGGGSGGGKGNGIGVCGGALGRVMVIRVWSGHRGGFGILFFRRSFCWGM